MSDSFFPLLSDEGVILSSAAAITSEANDGLIEQSIILRSGARGASERMESIRCAVSREQGRRVDDEIASTVGRMLSETVTEDGDGEEDDDEEVI